MPANRFEIGSRVLIVADTSGHKLDLFAPYTVDSFMGDRVFVKDHLGVLGCARVSECMAEGIGWAWVARHCPEVTPGSVARELLSHFAGKRFIRLRHSIRDRILLKMPDLKEQIINCAAADLDPPPEP